MRFRVTFVVGAVRNLELETNAEDLPNAINRMGINLYENPVPTGWSEVGEDWINSSLLIERIKWVLDPQSPNELYIGDKKLVRDWL